MKATLPRGRWMTLFRSSGTGKVGAYVNPVGGEGLAISERLFADRELIDEEFTDAGLPAPEWKRTGKGAPIGLGWPSPLPWDD